MQRVNAIHIGLSFQAYFVIWLHLRVMISNDQYLTQGVVCRILSVLIPDILHTWKLKILSAFTMFTMFKFEKTYLIACFFYYFIQPSFIPSHTKPYHHKSDTKFNFWVLYPVRSPHLQLSNFTYQGPSTKLGTVSFTGVLFPISESSFFATSSAVGVSLTPSTASHISACSFTNLG